MTKSLKMFEPDNGFGKSFDIKIGEAFRTISRLYSLR